MGKQLLYVLYLLFIGLIIIQSEAQLDDIAANSICVYSLYSVQCINSTNAYYDEIIKNGVSQEMKIIKCQHCQLDTLEEYMFSKNPKWSLNLHLIEIVDNTRPLRLVDAPFRGLESLEWLKLYNSQISSIISSTFEGIPNLKYLFLQNNNLTELTARVFSEIDRVLKINLNYNKIRVIHKNAFRGLRMLKELLLSGNDIKRIKDDTFKHLTSIKALDLSINPFMNLDFVKLHDSIPTSEIIKLQNIPCSTLLDILLYNVRNNYEIKANAETCDAENCLFVKVNKHNSKKRVIISILKTVEFNAILTKEKIGDIPCRRYKT